MLKYLVHIVDHWTPTGYNLLVFPKSLEIAVRLPVLMAAETAMVALVLRVPISISRR